MGGAIEPMARPAKRKKKRRRRGGPNARGELRRKELIDSAEALLTRNSVEHISYTDIASRAGLSLPSCYHFYKNKLELIQAVSERLGDKYRKEIMEGELLRAEYRTWEEAVDGWVDRSAEFVQRYPASVEVWYSVYAPPVVRARTSEREKGLAMSFKSFIESHFVMPELPDLDSIFYVFFEGFDRIFALSFTDKDNPLFYREEAKRIGKAYLRCYLPEYLPVRRPLPKAAGE